MTREARAGMTAAFVGARDGTLAAQLGSEKVFGPAGMPWYALPPDVRTEKTGEDLFRDFAFLVQRRDH